MDNKIEKIEIKIFTASNGKSLFEEWLAKLDRSCKKRIITRIYRIRAGNIGDYKPVGDGVSELRFDFGSDYRIYFGQEAKRIIILLYDGDKKTQKSDIEKAKKYWQEYQKYRR